MMGKEDNEYMKQLAAKYKEDFTPLLEYFDWLELKNGTCVSTNYNGKENGNSTMSFPVYDSNLLSFVKAADKTNLMDRNYVYVYSRLKLNTPEAERQAIERATIQDWNVLCGILTKYVRGGMTQSRLWSLGVTEGIFYLVLAKMKEVTKKWT